MLNLMEEKSRLTSGTTPLDKLSERLAQKKAFLFDFDGVLADSLPDIAASVNAALAHFGLPAIATDDVRCFVGDGARRLIERSFAAASAIAQGRAAPFAESDIAGFLGWYRAYYEARATERTTLYPGIKELLQEIRKKGFCAAAVTNKPSSLARIISERLGIAGLLDAIVGPEEAGGKTKPAPDGLIEALRRINARLPKGCRPCTAQDAVMTGDSPQDVLAGKRLPCTTCAVLKGYIAPQALFDAGADLYVNLASDLRNVLARA